MPKAMVVICSALLFLGGCATQAERQVQQMTVEWEDAQRKVNNCMKQARTTNEYQTLNKKFILDIPDPAAAQKMAIQEFASQEDKQNAILYRATFNPCVEIALTEWGQVHPAYAVAIAEYISQIDEGVSYLLTDKFTIGEYNIFTSRLSVAYERNLQQVNDSIQNNLSRSHQYEMEQRARAVAAFQNWNYQQQQLNQQQQMINAVNRPRTTTCSYIGRFLNCTTR